MPRYPKYFITDERPEAFRARMALRRAVEARRARMTPEQVRAWAERIAAVYVRRSDGVHFPPEAGKTPEAMRAYTNALMHGSALFLLFLEVAVPLAEYQRRALLEDARRRLEWEKKTAAAG